MSKIIIAVIFLLVAGGLGYLSYFYKGQITQMSKTIESERYSRLVAEEKVMNSVSKIKQLQETLSENEDKISKIQEILKEQKNVNKDLEGQYQKLSKSKAQLEEQIQILISQQAVAAAAQKAVEQAVEQSTVSVELTNQAVPPVN